MNELRDYVLEKGGVIANTILSTTEENMANENYIGADLHMDGKIEGYISFGGFFGDKMFFIYEAPDTNGFSLEFYIDETLGRVYHIHHSEKPFELEFVACEGASYTSCLKDEQKEQIREYIDLLSEKIKTLKVDYKTITSDMLDGEKSEGFTSHN